MEKLPIKNIAVSNPSLRIEKKTRKNIPHPAVFKALEVWPSRTALSLTFFANQKITYQSNPAVMYIKVASTNFSMEALPIDSFMLFRNKATKRLATIEVPTAYQSCRTYF